MTRRPHTAPLPPLHHRSTRTRLLLTSYLDALHPPAADTPAPLNGSHDRMLAAHNQDLWPYGSYPELQQALTLLHELATQHRWAHRAYHCCWSHYIRRDRRHSVRRHHWAEVAVHWLTGLMPEFLYVPAEIAENAGYTPAEAAQYSRRKAKSAA